MTSVKAPKSNRSLYLLRSPIIHACGRYTGDFSGIEKKSAFVVYWTGKRSVLKPKEQKPAFYLQARPSLEVNPFPTHLRILSFIFEQ
jgi:hypothetical protein